MKRYSLSINEDHYPHIADWLDEQANVSAAVRLLIQAQLNGNAAPASALPSVDLAGVRQVLEAVLDERLSGISLNAPNSDDGDDDELSAFDDMLG